MGEVTDASDEEIFTESDESSSVKSGKYKNLILDIPYDLYKQMQPISIDYGYRKTKRNYSVLKQGVWINIIYDIFLEANRLPCCFTLKRCDVYNDNSAKCFMSFSAVCKDPMCNSNLQGIVEKNF